MTVAYAQHPHRAASLDSIAVRDAMHRGLVTCRPDAPLTVVARLMAAHRIHAVVVAPETAAGDWRLVCDLDLAVAAGEGSIEHVTAGQVASMPTTCVTPEETLVRAVQLMREYDTHHLIVLGRASDRPVGVLSTLDVADVVAELTVKDETPRT